MGTRVSILTAVAITLLMGPSAAAQSRGPVPNTGMMAAGVSMGAAPAFDSALNNGLDLAGQFESYLTPRVSIRALVSKAWNDINDRPFTGTVAPIAVNGNVVYNWEGGAWHPYATAGVGLYHYTFTEGGLDSSDTKFGVNAGGGVEYFVTRHDTLTGEVVFHAIPGTVSSLRSSYDAGYWRIAGGYKKYFGR